MPAQTITRIHARDASPAAVAEAFTRAAAQTRHGLFGPIDAPMIVIPASRALGVQAPPREPRAAAAVRPQPRPVAAADRALASIRSSPYAIGGYAAVFNRTSRGGNPIWIAPGAFRGAIAARSVYLVLNHPEAGERPSLASQAAGSLHLEEDARGLWFEAALRDDDAGRRAFRLIHSNAAAGMSWGSCGGTQDANAVGGCRYTSLAIWEISIVAPPERPRFEGTWVAINGVARRRRF
jgi:HK97 family phage prohead protease